MNLNALYSSIIVGYPLKFSSSSDKSNVLKTTSIDDRGHLISGTIGISCSSLRECLRTHKVFTKDQCFYLNYHKFSIKSYVVDVYKNRLGEAILIHIHNI